MFQKSILVLLFVAGTLGEPSLPQLFCSIQAETTCRFEGTYLLEDQPRYNIISPVSNDVIETVNFYDQQLTVLSQDFCETFPRLLNLYVPSNKIEFVDQEAFASCFYVENIDLSYNRIQIIPPNLFKNNFRLRDVNLAINQIGQIATEQFERNYNLIHVSLIGNSLDTFPVSAVKNSKELQWVYLHTNNIYELDSKTLIANAPKLIRVMVNGNLFPCSKITEIMDPFRQAGITIEGGYTPRDRPFRMGEIEGFTCVDGQ